MEPHKALAPTSPPAWQRQSHPPHAAAPIESQDPPSSSQQEALKSDAPIHAIPAPAYIDLGSVKAEKDTPDVRQQLPATSVASTPAPSLPSPANMYLGPPPPYSSHYPSQPLTASTTAAVSQNGTVVRSSPPMSRRDSREETASEQPRQSLPSISEALKLPAIYTQQSQTSAPHPPSFSQAAGLSENTHSVTSGSPSISRSHTDSHHASSLSSYSSQPSPHHTKPPDPIGHRPYPTAFTESPRPAYGQPFAQPGISPTDAQATQTPRRTSPGPNGSFAGPPQPYSTSSLPPLSAASYPPWPAYASTAGPAPAPPPFSQAPPGHHAPPQPSHHPEPRQIYPPGSGYSFPPPATSGLTYHQSLSAGAAQQAYTVNAELEKVDEQRRAAAALYAKRGGSFHGVGYGMTVKRHLDDFDLENSLNEIAERTQQVLEFSRDYGREAHKYPRSAMPISQLPTTNRITDMLNQSLAITDALQRLKSTVDGMNIAAAAAEEQARQQQQQGSMHKQGMYSPYGSEAQGHPGYGMSNGQDKLGDKGDMGPGGGFAGGDSKKRRGRNAPPGRCHSCNRAETPEWRRGPDGARTLCNACGLHYAKLTRKMGVKTGQSGGSNLRPKDDEDTTV